jgi:hypothetical protein
VVVFREADAVTEAVEHMDGVYRMRQAVGKYARSACCFATRLHRRVSDGDSVRPRVRPKVRGGGGGGLPAEGASHRQAVAAGC